MKAPHPLLLDVWEGIRSRPGHLLLSLFTLATGMLTLTLLMAVLAGFARQSEQILSGVGANVAALLPAQPASAPRGGISAAHAELLRHRFPSYTVSVLRQERAPAGPGKPAVDILAGDEHLAALRGWPLLAGRPLDALDLRQARRACVLTSALSREWNAPVGAVVRLASIPFEVVGVLAPAGNAAAADSPLPSGDRFVWIPHTVSPFWRSDADPPTERFDAILVRVDQLEALDSLATRAAPLFADGSGAAADYAWVTPDTLLAGVRRLRLAVGFTVGAVAMLCLVLGAAMLMNVMASAVRERVPEIGLRRALGASARDIAMLFIGEAALTTTAAATIGVLAAALLLALAGDRFQVPLHMSAMAWFAPAAAALATAALCAAGPAMAAARITPYEALRND